MQYKSILNLSFKETFRNKQSYIYIMLISISFSLIILSVSFSKSLDKYWSESVKKIVDYRTYLVSYDQEKYDTKSAIEALKKYKYVEDSFELSGHIISMRIKEHDMVKNKNNSVLFIGTSYNPLKIVEGKKISKNNADNAIICARQFYPYLENFQADYVASKSIDIKNYLGKNIKTSFLTSDEIEKFRIIGLYDAKDNHTHGNVCYAHHSLIEKLNNKYQSEVYSNDINYIYVIINNIENKEIVEKELMKNGFQFITPTIELNKSLGKSIIGIIMVITIIAVILNICVIGYLFSKMITKDEINNAILKVSGYKDDLIIRIYLIKLIMEICTSIGVSLLLFRLIFYTINKFYLSNKVVFYNFTVNLNIYSILLIALVSIIIITIEVIILSTRLKKISIKRMIS